MMQMARESLQVWQCLLPSFSYGVTNDVIKKTRKLTERIEDDEKLKNKTEPTETDAQNFSRKKNSASPNSLSFIAPD